VFDANGKRCTPPPGLPLKGEERLTFMTAVQVLWLRRDLRLADQPALHAAAQAGPVIPVFVLDDAAAGEHAYGGASRWWLHHSLASLAESLGKLGSRIVLRRGGAAEELAQIARETGASAIHAIRHYEPWWRKAQRALKSALPGGCELCLHDGNYLAEPGSVTTGSGLPYKIYTPFSKAVLERMPPRDPLPVPPRLAVPRAWPASEELADWALLPTAPDWAGGLREAWAAGEPAAQRRLADFAGRVAAYAEGRNLPSQEGSSRLSPHLHWGEISPVQVWHALAGGRGEGWTTFEKELIWRDYAQQTIAQFPDYGTRSYREGFEKLWRIGREADADFAAWTRGRTGYPIVDAGMRQLWRTGWMHNRVRMIAASFLVKHLLIDWRRGAAWFWDCLVDADYGNNSVNWQWIAGTGVDSNMFSRIMAPLGQSEKFEAGGYIRDHVPELASLPDAQIHDPPDDARGDYPAKIVGHKEARERALAAYRAASR
jgi:deoxyribodipyrimidine photo-lyase